MFAFHHQLQVSFVYCISYISCTVIERRHRQPCCPHETKTDSLNSIAQTRHSLWKTDHAVSPVYWQGNWPLGTLHTLHTLDTPTCNRQELCCERSRDSRPNGFCLWAVRTDCSPKTWQSSWAIREIQKSSRPWEKSSSQTDILGGVCEPFPVLYPYWECQEMDSPMEKCFPTIAPNCLPASEPGLGHSAGIGPGYFWASRPRTYACNCR